MPPPILAHLGHWYVSLPVFMGPVLVLVVALKIQTWRDRRGGAPQMDARGGVTMTRDETTTTIAVGGSLDYHALLAIEAQLGEARQAPKLLLDLRRVTSAEESTIWALCDALVKASSIIRVSTLVGSGAVADTLEAALAVEGVRVVGEGVSDRA